MNQLGSEASESASPNYQQTHLSDGTTEDKLQREGREDWKVPGSFRTLDDGMVAVRCGAPFPAKWRLRQRWTVREPYITPGFVIDSPNLLLQIFSLLTAALMSHAASTVNTLQSDGNTQTRLNFSGGGQQFTHPKLSSIPQSLK